MDIEKVVHEVAEVLQRDANARAVFGEPVQLDQHTIVPVAMVCIELGGGGGGLSGGHEDKKPRPLGGGGGLDVKTVPVGFIHEKDGEVCFTAIPLPTGTSVATDTGLVEKVIAKLRG